ncbi:MAG: STAS domain-containing protein [Dehalococcoidales bacterium]
MNFVNLADNVFLVELPAELIDPDEKPILNATIPKKSGKKGSVLLDFTAVKFISGLGAYQLVKLNVLARRRIQQLLAFGVNQHYREVLKVTDLDQVITIYNSRDEAFTAAGVNPEKQPAGDVMPTQSFDVSFWAKPVAGLNVPEMPPQAINRNVQGRRPVGPVNGFGQLWQKTYRLEIDKPDLSPQKIIKILKQNLPAFQPAYNRFYPSPAGIAPGEIVAIDSATPGGPVSTGVLVVYADDVSFTFMTPQGHPESGWVTFSAFAENGKIIAQIMGLARANDFVYEAAFRAVGSQMQVNIWKHVLTSLAGYLEIPADVTVAPVCVDKHLQWSQAGNVWYNAQIRTIFYMPFRRMKKSQKKQ